MLTAAQNDAASLAPMKLSLGGKALVHNRRSQKLPAPADHSQHNKHVCTVRFVFDQTRTLHDN